MGDAADAILDGDFCQECGEYMAGGDGYPRTCETCLRAHANTIRSHNKKRGRKRHMDTGKGEEKKP